jgi:hypothetical protein
MVDSRAFVIGSEKLDETGTRFMSFVSTKVPAGRANNNDCRHEVAVIFSISRVDDVNHLFRKLKSFWRETEVSRFMKKAYEKNTCALRLLKAIE